MRINFYPIRNFDAAGAAGGAGMAALGAAGPVGLALGGLQTALGIYQGIAGGARSQRALRKRRAYQTPEEILDLAKFDQSRAGSGLSPQTLQYLTGNADNALSTSLGTAARLGGDPNQLSNLLEQRFQQNLGIGAQNQIENMKNYSLFRESLQTLAANDAAEQKSREDLIKDQLQAAGAMQQQAVPNVLGGGNTILNTLSSAKIAELFGPKPTVVDPLTGMPTIAPPDRTPVPLATPTSFGPTPPNPTTPFPTSGVDMNTLMQLLNRIKIGQ